MNALACGFGFFSDHPIRAIIGSNRGKNGRQTSERGKKLTAVSAKMAAALKASMLANIVETPSRSSDAKRADLKGFEDLFHEWHVFRETIRIETNQWKFTKAFWRYAF
jgi:hypothetical protein